MINSILLGIICTIFGSLITYFIQSISKSSSSEKMLEKYSQKLSDHFTKLLTHHVEVYHQDRTSELISEELLKYASSVEYKFKVRDDEIALIRTDMTAKSSAITRIEQMLIQISTACTACKDFKNLHLKDLL